MAAGIRRKRVVAALFFAAAVLFLSLLWLPSKRQVRSEGGIIEPKRSKAIQSVHRIAQKTVKPPAHSSPAAAQPGKPIPPVIDEITVEKEEVCEGEENLVTVKAHTLDGADPLLHASIAGERGMSVPVKTSLLPDGKPLHNRILVFGRNNVATVVDVPGYAVKPCRPDRVVTVGYRGLSNREDEFEFVAQVIENAKGDKPFNPMRYLWDFGDGETLVTPAGFATHAYRHDGPQKGLYSNWLVKVEVVGEAGESSVGRTSLQLLNINYADLLKFDVVTLSAQGTPRFPTKDKDGVVRQKFEIWHRYSEPVEIQSVTLIPQDNTGRRGSETRTDLTMTLVQTEIPVGKSIEAQLTLDTTQHPDLVALVYRLEGTSADGKKAIGEISVMAPPPKPTRENSHPIADQKLSAKIRRALQILGTDTISQEDLWRLEREGKLQ